MKRLNLTHLTALSSLALGVALAATVFTTQAQTTNACYDNGTIRAGVLQASLRGTTSGTNLNISLYDSTIDKWSITQDNGTTEKPPGTAHYSNNKVLSTTTPITIIVPKKKTTLLWINIGPRMPNQIRFVTDITEDSYQPVGPSASIIRRKASRGFTDYYLEFCDDNSAASDPHTWSFGVKIGDTWYDPQIKNDGSH